MGIVQRQAIKNNLISLVAVLVGALSVLLIYPNDKALQGNIAAITSWGLLLVPFVRMGTLNVMVRFLPAVPGDQVEAAGKLFTRAAAVMTAVLCLLALANWTIGDPVFAELRARGYTLGVLSSHRWTILGVTAALAFATLFTTHLVNFKRIAVPAVFNNLFVKLGSAGLFLLVFHDVFSREWLGPGLVVVYALAALGLVLYAVALGVLKLRWGKLNLVNVPRREVYSLALYSVVSAFGSRLAVYIDTISVDAVLGEDATGIYAFGVFVTGIMLIPNTAVVSITSPIVAEAWQRRDLPQLGQLYRDSSLVLFTIGGLVYAGTLICIPDVYRLTPNLSQYSPGYYVIVMLGAAKLFDLLTSINSNLIGMTDYYRWNLLFVVSLGIMNVALNAIFISYLKMGITGSALATMISSFLYNFLKSYLVWRKMKLQPLVSNHGILFLLLLGLMTVAYFIPAIDNPFVSILVRGSLLTGPFLLLLYLTNVVPPVRQLLRGGLRELLR